MREWLKCFDYDKQSTLTLDGQVFTKEEWRKLGQGSQKIVYKINNKNLCFFIPNKCRPQEQWNSLIQAEKNRLDDILELGLRAQKFEILPLIITSGSGTSYTIDVLVTQDFESLCREQSLVIYNAKGSLNTVVGKPSPFYALIARFKDKAFVQKILAKLVDEFAIGVAFKLPITAINYSLDDSEHFCFELSENPEEPPVARYMFWDVAGDFGGLDFPLVPTLDELKVNSKNSSFSPINTLANQLTCAIVGIIHKETEYKHRDEDLQSDIEASFNNALNDDAFLNTALVKTRQEAARFLKAFLLQPLLAAEFSDPHANAKETNKLLELLMQSAISIGQSDLIQLVLDLDPKPQSLITRANIDTFLGTAWHYKNDTAIVFFEEMSKVHEEKKLKQLFLDKYQAKLKADKGAFCGLYGLFARSHVTETMSLDEVVKHAKGQSKEGSGARSKAVLQELGWFDKEGKEQGTLNAFNAM